MESPIENEELSKLQQELAALENIDDKEMLGFPTPPDKENQFKFFKYIIDLLDSSKVGNLSESELGSLKLAVRHYQDIAAYAEAEDLPKVAKYLKNKGEIILSTSMSKKAKLLELIVTQIKREQKSTPPQQTKGGLFSKPKPAEE